MYTYLQWPGCKKENTATYVYIRAGSRTPTRAYVRRGLIYTAGSERRNNVVVVFMGRQRNASCSWGGNEIRRVHREATERVGANRLGRNGMRGRVHREGLDGTGDGNEAWRTAERRKRLLFDRPRSKRDPVHREGSGVPQNGGNGSPTVETGVLLIGRGVAYRKTEETDLCWTSYGQNGVLLIGRGVAYRKTEETDLCWSTTVETGVLFIRRGVAYHKTGLNGILFISTVDCLHGLLFIHR